MTKPLHDGLPVAGYKAQSDDRVAAVNANKHAEEEILRVIDKMQDAGHQVFDQRWLSIARTHLEQGFMALNRAVFRPERVKLPGE
jgi:hypothetical protein